MRHKTPYFFLALAVVLAAAAVVLLVTRSGKKPGDVPASPSPEKSSRSEIPEAGHEPIEGLDQPMEPATPNETMEDLGVSYLASDPAELLARVSLAIEQNNMADFSKLIEEGTLEPAQLARLKALASDGSLRFRKQGVAREIGELELNRRSRWALELEKREAGRNRIYFDLRRENGKWRIDQVTLPPPPGAPLPKAIIADPLGVADAFLQSVLRQDFETARDYVDTSRVSEAKIAALCILFEEGEFRMRRSKPLRAMFKRNDTVGYLANAVSNDGRKRAQFSLTLRDTREADTWGVIEINLDELLSDYAGRVAGGDLNYSPLVQNPAGGETLALYFDFDEDSMSPRTRRQLEIVASLLKSDPAKKITLSGHTDALGTKKYNDRLSANRARVVRDFLVNAGVAAEQIATVAKGSSQPRRPNITETGEDNPRGRRANRRTEIYLDF